MQPWLILLILIGSWGYGIAQSLAQGQPQQADKLLAGACQGPHAALNVTAERMTFDQRTRTFIFEEKVHVRRCAMTIMCDRLQVTNEAKGDNVEHITATGNVHVQQGTQHVTAERVDYFPVEQRLVFTGHPRAWDTQEQREITGEAITVFLHNENVLVQRAHVLFQPRNTPMKQP
jgi:lipopolysaccharide transport protein LptA